MDGAVVNQAKSWLNLPCTDPMGRVFTRDGRFFRAIYPRKAALVRSLLSVDNVARLMADGLLAKTWIADEYTSGTDLVLEVEAAPFDVPCDRFTTSCLQTAFERWIEISLRLEGAGLSLSDAHFGNFMLFGRNEPRWIDLGSVRPSQEVTQDDPFRGFDELWKGMLAPLLVLRHPSRRTRLARLAIADYPYQGPKTSTNEAPLPLEDFVTAEREELRRMLGTLRGSAAVLKTYEFACGKLGEAFARAPAPPSPGPVDPSFIRSLVTDAGLRRVMCLGGDVYAPLADALRGLDVVVVDEDETRLEGIAAMIKAQPASTGTVALHLDHVINRLFLRRPPVADVLISCDPFTRFPHDSEVMLENIAATLAKLTTRLAVVTTPRQYEGAVMQFLRGSFAEVTQGSTQGDVSALICRKSDVA